VKTRATTGRWYRVFAVSGLFPFLCHRAVPSQSIQDLSFPLPLLQGAADLLDEYIEDTALCFGRWLRVGLHALLEKAPEILLVNLLPLHGSTPCSTRLNFDGTTRPARDNRKNCRKTHRSKNTEKQRTVLDSIFR
jgi:hypothetical protein